ncbi:type II secretion system protein GspL [Inhella gelatinilytica]|uniref:General secretion pathway protein GspL n=1 Tax=Inhella gelatinilytica TaxID=2795030 RepID=A0A931NDA9_9BURK|nr:type II secretion system protein GspL [Inhella gelatinilytica]MBH9552409.1 general secretion pathway protein GspL [Inhella gelatinilytica]
MSTLLIPLPLRPRLASGASSPASGPSPAGEWPWVLHTPEGVQTGRSTLANLPRADETVLVPHPLQCSFHRTTLPKTAPNRWRAALSGLLEDHLLEDPDGLHLAVQPGALAGEPTWVCVTPRETLSQPLAALESAQRFVDRVCPLAWPTADVEAVVTVGETGEPLVRLSHAGGVLHLPAASWSALQGQGPAPVTWRAEPEAAVAAEALTGQPVSLSPREAQLVGALASGWNLLQFDLAPRVKGLSRLRHWAHRFAQPHWRRVRLGVAALIAVQLVGLNAWAWQQRQEVQRLKAAQTQALKQAFPRVLAVADAPLQMQREMDLLRAQTGQLGDQDFEALMAAATAAWPEDRGPTEALSFESGQLSWPATGWADAQVELMRQRLASMGWSLNAEAGRLTLRKARSAP